MLNSEGFNVDRIEYKRIPFCYSIYKTGYFGNLRKKINGVSKKNILKAILQNKLRNNLRLVFVVLIYGFIRILDLDNKKNSMTIYVTRN